jgi:hypothetical protein
MRPTTEYAPARERVLLHGGCEFRSVLAAHRLHVLGGDGHAEQFLQLGERQPRGYPGGFWRELIDPAEIFRADHSRVVSNATVNGFVNAADPATGRRSKAFPLAVTAARAGFTYLDLHGWTRSAA